MERCSLEVCSNSLQSALAAQEGGADRVELCSVLGCGGVTPSYGMIARARKVLSIRINVLIRPREGNFVYDDRDAAVVEEDIRACAALGVDGVVLGALTPQGTVDRSLMERWIRVARECGLSVTFHRAIDESRDVMEALDSVLELGCDCLLTSGGMPSAPQAAEIIRRMADRAGSRLCIMPGSGVNPENAAELVRTTGVRYIHSSARKSRPAESGTGFSDASVVRAIRTSLDALL